jgi:hypothetical protein
VHMLKVETFSDHRLSFGHLAANVRVHISDEVLRLALAISLQRDNLLLPQLALARQSCDHFP